MFEIITMDLNIQLFLGSMGPYSGFGQWFIEGELLSQWNESIWNIVLSTRIKLHTYQKK